MEKHIKNGSPDQCPACSNKSSNSTFGGLGGAISPQDRLTPVNPTVTHLMGCAKLYGNLCSCGADHKVNYPIGSTVSDSPINEKECEHWWRELMRNDNTEWYFYCQKCLEIKKKNA